LKSRSQLALVSSRSFPVRLVQVAAIALVAASCFSPPEELHGRPPVAHAIRYGHSLEVRPVAAASPFDLVDTGGFAVYVQAGAHGETGLTVNQPVVTEQGRLTLVELPQRSGGEQTTYRRYLKIVPAHPDRFLSPAIRELVSEDLREILVVGHDGRTKVQVLLANGEVAYALVP
jgi:hypothetical protein